MRRRRARVAVLDAATRIVIRTEDVPEPGAGEVRVRVTECGICGSDVKMFGGGHPVHTPPLRLGHEFVGVVDAVGEGLATGDGPAPGDEVVAYPGIGCGECYGCRRGQPQLCVRMTLIGGHLPGGFGDYVVMPAANAIPIDDDVPVECRVLIEPFAVALHAVHRAQLERGDRSLVVGAGPIGIFVALALRALGHADPAVADVSEQRLAIARELGFERRLAVGDGERIRDRLDQLDIPEGVEAVFECAGGPETADEALHCAAPGGRVVVVGVGPPSLVLDSIALQRADRSVIGSMMYSPREYRQTMRLLAGGAIPVDAIALIRRDVPLDEVGDAFASLADHRSDALKVVAVTGGG